ncbi:D-alanyl-D-alanine carboxypeptidase [Microbacterium marinilacus]|uniref:Peptidase S11 D-alanyl-D-alanine carboxypeptidase A N-terminal domain-containing protein n=1 Tax=Microbacterium marinilacus TaxID=415209 RepID=A0ABP7BL00_9MICO|nr:D-alanyl-D-alanine carboxypeptidase [Microbacterium marinilacus]MBY0689702.1 D-alanyl-D-alanine carboxypeptidase [Microbacterium marinilacus]
MATEDLPQGAALDGSDAASSPHPPVGAAETNRRADDELAATQPFDVAAFIQSGEAEMIAPTIRRRALSAAEVDPSEPALPAARSISARRVRRSAPGAAAQASRAERRADDQPDRPTPAALAWVDPAGLSVAAAPASLSTTSHVPATTYLLPPPRERRGSVAAPLITAGAVAIAYVAGCALWPLANVAPDVSATQVQSQAGHPLGLTWPAEGTAAVGAEGLGTVAAQAGESVPMASIAKLVTALMILDRAPLDVDEDGPSYAFTYADSQLYWQYRVQNESALDVPVDGTLTQRELLEGILVGSANNYIDRLTTELWGSKDAFVLQVPAWLEEHGLSGITMVDASGIDPGNVATPAALVKLAGVALADPVIAEIVAMPEIDLPGAGVVENTNPLLGDQGVVGIKTGTLSEWWIESWNLLTAKDITIGQTTVRVYAAVLGQPDEDARESVSRSLLDEVEQSLQSDPAVPVGTTVATVTTEWGEPVDIVTAEDASVVLWDNGTAELETDYDPQLGESEGSAVGELTATGPFDSATVPLALADDLTGPSLFWRLSHPLDLLGLQ